LVALVVNVFYVDSDDLFALFEHLNAAVWAFGGDRTGGVAPTTATATATAATATATTTAAAAEQLLPDAILMDESMITNSRFFYVGGTAHWYHMAEYIFPYLDVPEIIALGAAERRSKTLYLLFQRQASVEELAPFVRLLLAAVLSRGAHRRVVFAWAQAMTVATACSGSSGNSSSSRSSSSSSRRHNKRQQRRVLRTNTTTANAGADATDSRPCNGRRTIQAHRLRVAFIADLDGQPVEERFLTSSPLDAFDFPGRVPATPPSSSSSSSSSAAARGRRRLRARARDEDDVTVQANLVLHYRFWHELSWSGKGWFSAPERFDQFAAGVASVCASSGKPTITTTSSSSSSSGSGGRSSSSSTSNSTSSSSHTGAGGDAGDVAGTIAVGDDLADFPAYARGVLRAVDGTAEAAALLDALAPLAPHPHAHAHTHAHNKTSQPDTGARAGAGAGSDTRAPAPTAHLPIDDAVVFDNFNGLFYHGYPNYVPPPVVPGTARHVVIYQRDSSRALVGVDDLAHKLRTLLNQPAEPHVTGSSSNRSNRSHGRPNDAAGAPRTAWSVEVVRHSDRRAPCELVGLVRRATVLFTPHGFQRCTLVSSSLFFGSFFSGPCRRPTACPAASLSRRSPPFSAPCPLAACSWWRSRARRCWWRHTRTATSPPCTSGSCRPASATTRTSRGRTWRPRCPRPCPYPCPSRCPCPCPCPCHCNHVSTPFTTVPILFLPFPLRTESAPVAAVPVPQRAGVVVARRVPGSVRVQVKATTNTNTLTPTTRSRPAPASTPFLKPSPLSPVPCALCPVPCPLCPVPCFLSRGRYLARKQDVWVDDAFLQRVAAFARAHFPA